MQVRAEEGPDAFCAARVVGRHREGTILIGGSSSPENFLAFQSERVTAQDNVAERVGESAEGAGFGGGGSIEALLSAGWDLVPHKTEQGGAEVSMTSRAESVKDRL